jgi:LPXTG-motif cell wall-anchored protein
VRNAIIGPFAVATNGQVATGRVPAGVTAYADAAGASPLISPFSVTNGQQIWLRATEIGVKNPALTITAVATTPGGGVYLYVPPQSNPNAQAQTIIQAGPLTAETDVSKTVVFLDDIGQFTITKTITGSGAGSQGAIRIDIACIPPNSSVPPFIIPANAPAGVVTTVVTGITVPTKCKVIETASGDIEIVDVFAEPEAAASRAVGPRAVAPRRVALNATQEISVCPETPSEQPLSATAGAEFQSSPGAHFENHVETTTTTAGSTTTSSTTSTTSSTSSTDSTTTTTTGETTTTGATTTAATTTGATTTGATTTGATTTGATTTGATTTGATTTGATTTGATTTGATTTGATTTAAAVVPTTAPNECEFAGDTTTTATTGPETLPATGSSGSGPLAVGLIGLLAGIGLVALASRRGFTD